MSDQTAEFLLFNFVLPLCFHSNLFHVCIHLETDNNSFNTLTFEHFNNFLFPYFPQLLEESWPAHS